MRHPGHRCGAPRCMRSRGPAARPPAPRPGCPDRSEQASMLPHVLRTRRGRGLPLLRRSGCSEEPPRAHRSCRRPPCASVGPASVAVARSGRLVLPRGAAPWPADRSRRRRSPGLGTRPRCRSSGLPPADRSACWWSGLAAPGPWSRLRGPARRARRGRSSIRRSARGTRGFRDQFRALRSSTGAPQDVHSLSSVDAVVVPSLSPDLCTEGALLERFRNCADTSFSPVRPP